MTGALNLRQVRDEAEKDAVLRVLGRVNGNLEQGGRTAGRQPSDAVRPHASLRVALASVDLIPT